MCMVVSLMCNLIARIVSTGSQSVNIHKDLPHLIMISPIFSVTQVQVCNKTSCVKTNTLT